MSQLHLTFEIPVERVLRLRDARDVLQKIMTSPPSKTTLMNWLEEGRLEGKRMSFGWIIYESSLKQFIYSMQRDKAA